jgi:hypothetical protein
VILSAHSVTGQTGNVFKPSGETMPRVSVVIPAYNREKFVAQTVDSVLAQTYPDFEVIVVDDGSTDNTRAVLAHYGARIKYIYQENRGQAAARNKGLLASQGKYLLFLDSDDLIPPDKLELQVTLLEARPEFGLVYSGRQFINQAGEILGEVRPNKQGQLLKDMLLRRLNLGTTGVVVVRRECFEKAGLFDESLRRGDDTDMWCRIAKAGYAFGCVQQPLIQYRINPEGLHLNVSPQDIQCRFASLDKFFADPDLPDDIKALRAEAYGVLHYETAMRYYRAGKIDLGQEHLRKAIATHPPLSSNKEWLLDWITSPVADPRVTDPLQAINLILANLPAEAATLHSLRRRIRGRYHVTTIFHEYQNRRLKTIPRHILPAVLGDPSILRNRGFISISCQALMALLR